MPIRARSTLLLDLDGTLVDPSPGILGSYRHALASFGVFLPETEDLRWVIGPSIREGLGELLDGRGDTEEAVRRFRERYSQWGLYQATVYPGILQALAGHRARGTRLVLCTAKFHGFARRAVDHFGLTPLLSGVYGPELDGRFEDKAELIAHLLEAEDLHPTAFAWLVTGNTMSSPPPHMAFRPLGSYGVLAAATNWSLQALRC